MPNRDIILSICIASFLVALTLAANNASHAEGTPNKPCQFSIEEAQNITPGQTVQEANAILHCQGVHETKDLSKTNIGAGSGLEPYVWESRSGAKVKAAVGGGVIVDMRQQGTAP